MKCISMTSYHSATIRIIVRVSDERARELVASRRAQYATRDQWRAAGRRLGDELDRNAK